MSDTTVGGRRSRSATAGVKHFLGMLVPSLEDIREHRPILPPLVAGWILALVSAVSLRPLVLGSLPAEQAGYARGVEALLWILALLAPLIQLLKAGLLTAVGWAVLVLTNADRRIRPILSVLLYGEAILAMQGVLLALFLHFTTGGSVSSPEEFQVSLGLAAFVPPSRPMLLAVAQNLSVVHLAWFWFLLVALRKSVGLGPREAVGLACFFWGALLALAATRSLVAF